MAVIRMSLARQPKLTGPRADGFAEANRRSTVFTGLIVGRAPEMRQFLRRQVCEPAARGGQWFEASDVASARQVLGKVDVALVAPEPAAIRSEVLLLGAVGGGSPISRPRIVVIGEHDDPDTVQQILDGGVECYVATRPPRHIWANELRCVIFEFFEKHQDLKNTAVADKREDSSR